MPAVKDPPGRTRRQLQASATRRRIVVAALTAFLDEGYAATTMASIARDADVAVQTVYFTFRTKGDLLQAVYEHVVLGPRDEHPHETAWWRAVDEAEDVESAVHTLVAGTVTILKRAAPLVWAVLGEPTARAAHEHNEALRRRGNEHLVETLTAKHPLRPGLSPTKALDLLLVITGPQLFAQLSLDLDWTDAEISSWMAASVLRELFAVDS